MTRTRRWEPAVSHHGEAAKLFFREYFGRSGSEIILIGGAGFDPRACSVATLLAESAPGRVRGFFIREERPRRDDRLRASAEGNIDTLKKLVKYDGASINIISEDGAIIGGQEAAPCVQKHVDFSGATDIIVDFSALSKGVSFPIMKALLDRVIGVGADGKPPNVHAVVLDQSWTDASIIGEAADRAETIRGFHGQLDHDDMKDAAKLWLPQLTKENGTKGALRKIYQRVNPDGVCPILPFPAFHPRLSDELLQFHSEDIQNEWQVDSSDLIYADEKSPLDLYRTILRIDDARRHVYGGVGGSMLVLSPVGSKALAIGCMMAAYERDFPIVYVESTGYTFEQVAKGASQAGLQGELIHVWLTGDAYPACDEGS